MNTIYELQRLLEERNVQYRLIKELGKDTLYFDWVDQCGDYTKAIHVMGACITTEIKYLSPEQAIAATLGGKCEWTINKKCTNSVGDDYIYVYEADCGAMYTWWPNSLPNFCPTCGGKVKAVER